MDGERGVSADFDGVHERVVHEHLWPGVDVALTDFPHRDAMRAAVDRPGLGGLRSVSLEPSSRTPDGPRKTHATCIAGLDHPWPKATAARRE
jgi:hypothetical protein